MKIKYNKKIIISYISKFFFFFFVLFFFLFHNEVKVIFFGRPKLSIILSIYNKEKYLNRSIGSILNQTFKDIEIIKSSNIFNELSVEPSLTAKKNDSRIKIVNNDKNCGLSYSRAMGILNSTGEYIMFLDPDDLFEGKDNLEYLYNQYKNTKEDVIIFNY